MNPANNGNAEGTGTIGGWGKSEMRTYLNETIWPLLPETLKSNIKTVKKYSTIFDVSGTMTIDNVTEDKIWLLSLRETYGVNGGNRKETLGPIYNALFTNMSSRIRTNINNTSVYWMIRTPKDANNFYCFNAYGDLTDSSASYARSVVFGFCV